MVRHDALNSKAQVNERNQQTSVLTHKFEVWSIYIYHLQLQLRRGQEGERLAVYKVLLVHSSKWKRSPAQLLCTLGNGMQAD